MADTAWSFWRRPEHDRDARALYDPASARWWTYGELWGAVDEVTAAFGSEQKQLVFLRCRNDLATVVGLLASLEAGHAVALLDALLDPALAQALEEAYRPDVLLHSPDEGGALPTLREGAWDGVATPVNAAVDLLLSTSGTTGSPKFARLSRGNLAANARSIVAALGIQPDDCAVSCLPLHYSYGLSLLTTHLLAGARMVLTDASLLSEQFWGLVRQEGCTSLAGVPYSYHMLRRLDLDSLDVPSLRVMTQAGGKLGNELILQFHAWMNSRGGRFYVMYGQTEATARISVLPWDRLPDAVGSVGFALPEGRLEIEVDGVPATSPGQVGEIVYSGPNVMLGYANDRGELGEGDVMGGVLHTGDLGMLDADGMLRVTGRSTRIAKVFGLRVNLEEVEAHVRRWAPAAVLGADDRLIIFMEHGGPSDEARGKELARRFRVNFRAFDFRSVDRLPLTANGKIDYRALEADL